MREETKGVAIFTIKILCGLFFGFVLNIFCCFSSDLQISIAWVKCLLNANNENDNDGDDDDYHYDNDCNKNNSCICDDRNGNINYDKTIIMTTNGKNNIK